MTPCCDFQVSITMGCLMVTFALVEIGVCIGSIVICCSAVSSGSQVGTGITKHSLKITLISMDSNNYYVYYYIKRDCLY